MILVTGATGFIGSNLIKQMDHLGVKFIGLTRPQELAQRKFGSLIESNVVNWPNIIAELSPKAIICCDWNGIDSQSRHNALLQEENYARVISSVRAAIDSGCRKVMVLGSQSEYGTNSLNLRMREDSPLKPQDAYSNQKVRLFETLLSLTETTKTTLHWPVIHSVYGIGDRKNSFISLAISSISHGRTFGIKQPDAIWNFLHVSDLVESLMLIFSEDRSVFRINVGHETSKSLMQYGKEIAKILGRPDLVSRARGDTDSVHNLNPDIGKLTSLGWYPRVEFSVGISEIYESVLRSSNV